MKRERVRLGVNIDHVATVRNARGGAHPDPARAAEAALAAGADGITAHLREDRRHIRDDDLARIQAATNLPLNLEMAASDEMVEIALRHSPHAACIVDRSGGRADVGVPLIALATLDVPAYPADALPPELAALPVEDPGSRRLSK